MKTIKLEQIPKLYRLADILLWPFMFILGGFKFDSIIETHLWHIQNFKTDEIDLSLCIKGIPDVESKYSTRGIKGLALFHMKIFGGWNKYMILENPEFKDYWNVGWHVVDKETGKLEVNEICKLKIYDKNIKLLKAHKFNDVFFFGINPDGLQVKPIIIDVGVLGDNKWPKVRLF